MHKSRRSGFQRSFLAIFALALLSACSSTGPKSAPATTSAAKPTAMPASVAYCPDVVLREGTGSFRQGSAQAPRHEATITSVTRACREKDGVLLMEVTVTGRFVPGPQARPGTVELPIRVAILHDGKLVHSVLGRQGIIMDVTGGPKPFRYVDNTIRIPNPKPGSVTVYAGFDEGATGR